jgi:hypothetical protein
LKCPDSRCRSGCPLEYSDWSLCCALLELASLSPPLQTTRSFQRKTRSNSFTIFRSDLVAAGTGGGEIPHDCDFGAVDFGAVRHGAPVVQLDLNAAGILPGLDETLDAVAPISETRLAPQPHDQRRQNGAFAAPVPSDDDVDVDAQVDVEQRVTHEIFQYHSTDRPGPPLKKQLRSRLIRRKLGDLPG